MKNQSHIMEHKTLIIMLIFAIIVAACTYFIFQSRQVIYALQAGQSSEAIAQRVDNLDQHLEEKMELFRQKESIYKQELVSKAIELLEARQKSEKLETRIKNLIAKNNQEDDTLVRLADCEKLKDQILDYMQQSHQMDSLTGQLMLETTAYSLQKDTLIQALTGSYDSLKSITNQAIQSQQALEKQLVKTQTKLKHKTFANRILAGAVLVLSGLAGSYFIQH